MHSRTLIFSLLLLLNLHASGMEDAAGKWSVKMANTVISKSGLLINYAGGNPKWAYDVAFLGMAMDRLGKTDSRYSDYMKEWVDHFVQADGSITDYKASEYNLDRIYPGRNILTLYRKEPLQHYKMAVDNLIAQLRTQPKTNSGGYWHKKIYPFQMWLDGIYMASTFMVQYAKEFNSPEWYDVAVNQTIMAYEKTLDPATGLLMHAWDESRQQKWCDPLTGKSHYPWSRATGWYIMAITEMLDDLPQDHPGRDRLIGILQNTCAALLKVQDKKSGLWYQVLNHAGREGNYQEASGSAMFIYVYAKGARLGYLDSKYRKIAEKSFNGFVKNLVTTDASGLVTVHNICGGCGLGGNPYRDGSYEYYINEKRIDNDTKGVAPFILAALELDK